MINVESNNSILQEDLNNIAKEYGDFSFLKNKTILVSGATGFIGSIFIKAILCIERTYNLGIKIIGLYKDKVKLNGIYKETLDRNNLIFIDYDLLDLDNNLSEKLKDNKVDIILHTANITNSKMMIEKPVDVIDTAYLGTKKLLTYATNNQIESFIYLSSMEEYGSFENSDKITEDMQGFLDTLDVRSNYPLAKRICENLCIAYNKQYNVSVRIVRLAQVFGPGVSLSDNRVFMQFAKAVINQNDIVLQTKGLSESNTCYSKDAIMGILKVIEKGKDCEAYNIVNESNHCNILGMANLVSSKLAKNNIKVIIKDSSDSNCYAKDVKLHLLGEKLNRLGFSPNISLTTMYDRLIKYIREQSEK